MSENSTPQTTDQKWASPFWRSMEGALPLGVAMEVSDGMVMTTKEEFIRLCRIAYAARATWAAERGIPELAEALEIGR